MRWVGGQYDDEYDESFTSFTTRVEAALGRIVNAVGPNRLAVVFTSGGVVSWVAASLLGGTSRLWTQLVPVMVNSSVSKVVVGRRGSTLLSLNDHSHLEGAGPAMLTYV